MCSFNESVINAKVFATYFRDICTRFVSPQRDPSKCRNRKKWYSNLDILNFLSKVKESIACGKCDEGIFKNEVITISRRVLIHIEIWWYMMKCDLISPGDIIRIFENKDNTQIAELVSSSLFTAVFLSSNNSDLMKNVASDFIEIIIANKEISQHMYKNIFNHVRSYVSQNNLLDILNGNLTDVLQMTSLDRTSKKSFLLDFLESFLNDPKIQSHDDVLMKSQNYLKNFKTSQNKTVKAFQCLSATDIVTFLKNALTKQSLLIHYENLFHLLSYISSHYKDTLKPLKDIVPFVLEEALANLNDRLLLNLFIVARHCSFPHMKNSLTYLQWFASTFSSESARPINIKEKAEFFLKFLTRSVQYDSSYYLKVHINRVPFLPIECQSMLSDYVQIVKTRLNDLNESFDLGLFDNTTDKTSAEFDVDTMLSIFASTGVVPKSILEASLFCKVYYEKKFMTKLLSKYEGKNSVRHKLIMKLKSLGKVPNSLFVQYKNLM